MAVTHKTKETPHISRVRFTSVIMFLWRGSLPGSMIGRLALLGPRRMTRDYRLLFNLPNRFLDDLLSGNLHAFPELPHRNLLPIHKEANIVGNRKCPVLTARQSRNQRVPGHPPDSPGLNADRAFRN